METNDNMVKQVSQKEAVFNAVSKVLGEAGVEFAPGETIKSKLTSELKKKVSALVEEGLANGSVVCRKEKDSKKIKNYAVSLLGNWLNRDSRYNLSA